MKEKRNEKIEELLIMVAAIIITIITLLCRIEGISFKSGDFIIYLEKWFQTLKENGGIFALKLQIGNYNIPYLTILSLLTYLPIQPLISVKSVSIIFDYIMAICMSRLIITLMKDKKNKSFYGFLVYVTTLLLPTVILNSAFWGQCDSIYATFIIISLTYLIEEKYLKSFIFLGISFAFKLQFAFVLPVYVLIYISKRKFPIYYFLILPIVNFIMCLPAMIFGRTISSCMSIYFSQTTEINHIISLNFPGIYNLICEVPVNTTEIPMIYEWMPKVMLLLTMSIFAIVALYVIIKRVEFNKEMIIEVTLWSVLVSTYFLPYMHERYMYVAEIISIIYFIINRNRKNLIYIPIALNLCSICTYIVYLYKVQVVGIKILSILNCSVLILVTINLIKNLRINSRLKEKRGEIL